MEDENLRNYLYCGQNCQRLKREAQNPKSFVCYTKTSQGDCVVPGEKCIYDFTLESGIADNPITSSKLDKLEEIVKPVVLRVYVKTDPSSGNPVPAIEVL